MTLKSGSLLALLAHGLPVIATHHDPPEPLLADEKTVRLVSPRSVDELTTALIDLLQNPEQQTALRQAGLAFAQNFTWDAIAHAHAEIYQSLCKH